MITAQAIALTAGFILDLIFGDPDFKLHPVRLMGALISLTEKITRRIFPKGKAGEITAGAVTVIIVIVVCGGVPFAALFFAYKFNFLLGLAIETIICYFMLSAKSLRKSSMEVYRALLRGDTKGARRAVSMIVGRDTKNLDEVGITKAAVETVAENTSDGVVAPLLYMAIGGGVLGCVYKAINTMDSMLGYKNDKYINFGKVAARLDDIANFIPSRIAALIMIISAHIVRLDGSEAWRIWRRDRKKHSSPNSAQTEAAAAGALRIQLGGDAYYFGTLYKKPYIGDDLRDIQYDAIAKVNRLMYAASVISAAVLIAAKFTAGYFI